jgi:tripartite ATP-independent transporter DctM subunit
MEWSGFALLILVGVGIISTGLPAAFILIGAATLGALFGIATGTIPFSLLWALPGRLINLFDNDLLQALPLYVTMGLLLGRLPVADALYRTSNAMLPKTASAPLISGMLLGALLGPMNGSVGASVLGLSRVVSPKLTAEGVPAATRDAIIAVASTLGVLVPPSLVLILLSSAMLDAHTVAVTITGRSDRVINTQDVFRAALVPAMIFIALSLALAWRAGHGQKLPPGARETVTARQMMLAAVALIALLVLLGGVATGYFYAVEAAAVGAFTLLCAGLITGQLPSNVLRELLHDAIAITGALFSLLIAATTLTLVLRLLGTDRLVNNLVAGIPGGDIPATAVVLGVIGLCAFVLDAFEIIFVIIPIVIPPLLIRVADARWVSALVLLTLQSSFLLPPFGYALMMVRGAAKNPAPFRPFVRALVPFLLAQWMLLVVVLLVPKLVHFGENAADNTRAPAAPVSNEEIDKRMRDMLPPPPPPPHFEQK